MGGSADRLELALPASELHIRCVTDSVRMLIVQGVEGFCATFPAELVYSRRCARTFQETVDESLALRTPPVGVFHVRATRYAYPWGLPGFSALPSNLGLRFRTRVGPDTEVAYGPSSADRTVSFYVKEDELFFGVRGEQPARGATGSACPVADWFLELMRRRSDFVCDAAQGRVAEHCPYLEIELWFTQT